MGKDSLNMHSSFTLNVDRADRVTLHPPLSSRPPYRFPWEPCQSHKTVTRRVSIPYASHQIFGAYYVVSTHGHCLHRSSADKRKGSAYA